MFDFEKLDQRNGISAVAPSQHGRYLAVCPNNQGVWVYDVLFAPPRLIRKDTKSRSSRVVECHWSMDNSQLCVLYSSGEVQLLSMNLPPSGTVISAEGKFVAGPLTVIETLRPVLEKKKRSKDRELTQVERLVDVKNPEVVQASALTFHPAFTALGGQPCVVSGLRGGLIVKHNTSGVEKCVYGECAVPNVQAGDSMQIPHKEYFVSHRHRVRCLGWLADSLTLASVDEHGMVSVWPYMESSFSGYGWFVPDYRFRVEVDGCSFRPAGEGDEAMHFPPAGVKMPKRNSSRFKALADAADKEFEALAKQQSLDVWSEKQGADGGTTVVFKPRSLEEGESARFHVLQYGKDQVLGSHRSMLFEPFSTKGRILDAQIDPTGHSVVFLTLFEEQHFEPKQLRLFSASIREQCLKAPVLSVPIPQNARQDGIAFSVTSTEYGGCAVYILVENEVRALSLDTGRPLLPGTEKPLGATGRKILLTAIKSFGRNANLVLTSPDSSQVYLYAVEDTKQWEKRQAEEELRTRSPGIASSEYESDSPPYTAMSMGSMRTISPLGRGFSAASLSRYFLTV